MSEPKPPELLPVANDGIRATWVGLGLWAAAGLILVVMRDELAARGSQWWIWTCGAALIVGLVLLVVFSSRRASLRAREEAADAADSGVEAGPTG